MARYINRYPMSDGQRVAYATHRRRNLRKRIAAIALGAVAAVFIAAVGCYTLFMASLNDALSRNTDKDALEVLSEPADSGLFYMLVLASDSRRTEVDEEASQQTDVMILMRVDAYNRQVTMLSIPRDTPYEMSDGSVVKMNALYNAGGVPMVIRGVSELTGVDISHYAMIYMSDCKNVVDALGGVRVDVPIEINNNDPETEENVNIQPGLQVLDGRQAQAFAISRHEAGDSDQDAYRQQKVRSLIGAIIDKVLDRPVYEIPGMVVTLAGYVDTDLSAENLVDLAVKFATGSGKVTVYQASGPSEGGIDEESKLWLCYPNPEGWAEAVSVMDAGGDPSTVSYD